MKLILHYTKWSREKEIVKNHDKMCRRRSSKVLGSHFCTWNRIFWDEISLAVKVDMICLWWHNAYLYPNLFDEIRFNRLEYLPGSIRGNEMCKRWCKTSIQGVNICRFSERLASMWIKTTIHFSSNCFEAQILFI